MKKSALLPIPLLLVGIAVLVAVTIPLMAQVPGGNQLFQSGVRVAPGAQNPLVPLGIQPLQVKAAYGFNRIPNLGQGQTIAIVDPFDAPNIESDLAFYANYYHMTPCNFHKVKIGNPQPDTDWAVVISLDVEQVCALAPQANIILVEAENNYGSNIFPAVQAAYSAPNNATVVSMNWSRQEFPEEVILDSLFCNILSGNGHPVSFVGATGDYGHGAFYPASSPCVVAVGGTKLVLASATPLPNIMQLNYGNESAWEGSSGGVSVYEPQMSWQNTACSTWSTTNRCTPDVSSIAYNIPVYDTYGYSGWVAVQGTSISTADWAAFLTLVNSVRAGQGKDTLSQPIYDLYQAYYGNYAVNFHDITTGNNGTCGAQCNAAAGYDLVTGMGTFQAHQLVNTLVAAPN